ncbi:MAG: cytochrome C oxidase subunit IV family protein [Phycisphaerales bacterium]|nr:cytochrome C oxidase subunit IV family protein [Phycisphaerales bacterium]
MAHAASTTATTAHDHAAHGSSHGAHGGGHGHHIVPRRVLLLVLGILMFFTLATVGAALAEQWIAATFNIVIPQWVNVAVALSIAVVKSIVVAAFFMQLKYDNPVNSLVVVFTLFCFAFFLGFTMIDLGNRGIIYDYKGQHITRGGTGNLTRTIGTREVFNKETNEKVNEKIVLTIPEGTSVVAFARQQADLKIDTILSEAMTAGKRPLARELLTKTLQQRLANVVAERKVNDKPLSAGVEAYLHDNPAVLAMAHSGHHGGGSHASNKNSAQTARPVRTLKLPGAIDEHAGAEHGSEKGAGHGAGESKPAAAGH